MIKYHEISIYAVEDNIKQGKEVLCVDFADGSVAFVECVTIKDYIEMKEAADKHDDRFIFVVRENVKEKTES